MTRATNPVWLGATWQGVPVHHFTNFTKTKAGGFVYLAGDMSEFPMAELHHLDGSDPEHGFYVRGNKFLIMFRVAEVISDDRENEVRAYVLRSYEFPNVIVKLFND